MGVFSDVARLFGEYVDLKAREYASGAMEETRKIAYGVILFAVGGFFWGASIMFLFVSLFFRLAPGLDAYSPAAAWTGLSAAAVAALSSFIAYRRLKRRRPGYAPAARKPVHAPQAASAQPSDDGKLRL